MLVVTHNGKTYQCTDMYWGSGTSACKHCDLYEFNKCITKDKHLKDCNGRYVFKIVKHTVEPDSNYNAISIPIIKSKYHIINKQ